jgi:hypothetical protein
MLRACDKSIHPPRKKQARSPGLREAQVLKVLDASIAMELVSERTWILLVCQHLRRGTTDASQPAHIQLFAPAFILALYM